jgi:hypothetical protein
LTRAEIEEMVTSGAWTPDDADECIRTQQIEAAAKFAPAPRRKKINKDYVPVSQLQLLGID